jgi:hypothetical protein
MLSSVGRPVAYRHIPAILSEIRQLPDDFAARTALLNVFRDAHRLLSESSPKRLLDGSGTRMLARSPTRQKRRRIGLSAIARTPTL